MNRKIGVILSYVLMVFEVLSTLLLTPFIINKLGETEYGVYKLTAAINAYLLLLDLGVGNAVIRYISKFREEKKIIRQGQFLGVALFFYISIGVFTLIIGSIMILLFPSIFEKGLSPSEIKLGQLLFSITMINTAITLSTSVYNNILIAYEKFAVSRITSIIQIIFRIVFTYICLLYGMKSLGIVVVNLVMTILNRVFVIIFVTTHLKIRPIFKGIDKLFIKEIVGYSSLIFIQMIATQINATADQLMLGILITSSSSIIGIYSLGSQIVQYFQSIGFSFNSVLMPGIVKMVINKATPSQICKEMVKIGRLIFMVMGLIWSCFLLYGKQFIFLWVGTRFSESYYIAMILMTAYLFIITESIGTQVLWAKNEHKEQSLLKILIVFLNIFLTVILIKWNPLFGATIGTFISLFLGDIVVMNIVFSKKIGISLSMYYHGLLKGIIICIIIVLISGILIIKMNLNGWIGFILNVSISSIIYALSLYLFGMTKYEKNLILSLLGKKNN